MSIAPPPIHSNGAVAACQNKIYVIGGNADKPTQVYDPATDIWENRTSPPGTTLSHQATVVADKIYVISGGAYAMHGIIAASAANYVYDTTTDSWFTMASIPTPVVFYASAVLDGKIYIIGGGTATTTPNDATDLVQIFNPATNQWTNGTSIPTGVYGAGACATSGLIAPKRIYVVGGSLRYDGGGLSVDASAQSVTNLTQVYDIESGTWSSAASLPDNRWFPSLVNVNDALYAVGGRNGSRTDIYGYQYRKSRLAPLHVQATEKYIPLGYDESLLPTPSPSPTPAPDGYNSSLFLITLSAVAIVTVAAVGLAVYHKKHKKNP